MTKQKKSMVLISEDDAFLAGIMQKTLQDKGVDAHVVHDGKKAMKQLDATKPDLLLLDLLLPSMDGFEILQHIQEMKYKLPVVIVSNISDSATQQKCKKLGCKKYLVKSDIDDDMLWPAIRSLLV